MERILSFEAALTEVMTQEATLPAALGTETVPLLEAHGRTLAVEVRAERDQPPFPRSTRDGYALFSRDLGNAAPLNVIGSIRAGEVWGGPALEKAQAIEIMTGAPLPAGADAVLMVEHARLDGDHLHPHPNRVLRPGENVVPQGAEARAFTEVIPAGRRVGAAEISLAAACGCARLVVNERPRVAIVATGDELVELNSGAEAESGSALQPSQIRNSNSYALAALVSEEGGDAVRLPIARDTKQDLRHRLQTACEHDLILFSGGVSMGRYDLVEPVLAAAGAEFFFTGALIQPGKPVVFGRLPRARVQGSGLRAQGSAHTLPPDTGWTYFFGLPGNPVSTEVCFRLFVAPLLRALTGRTDLAPRFVEARLTDDVSGGAKVTRFLPAELTSDWRHAQVRPIAWQGSGDLAANAKANGFVVLPAGVERFAAGESVRVLLR